MKVAQKNGRRRKSQKEGQPFLFEHQFVDIKNEFGEEIIRVDGDIPVNLPVNDGDRFLFISYDQSILTHGLHKYPAKELPRWLIQRYSKKKDRILDPFSGSGTTNVEACAWDGTLLGLMSIPFLASFQKSK